ncbi:MAG: redoxin domain-containing protein, partial [Bacteroidota bacterium]
MSLRLGDIAPNFKVVTTAGEIDFYEYLGDSWGILFSHPADYTPVCTTELGMTAKLEAEFTRRNTRVLAVSVDPIDK